MSIPAIMTDHAAAVIESVHGMEQMVRSHRWSDVSAHLAAIMTNVISMVETLEGIDATLATEASHALAELYETAQEIRKRNDIGDDGIFTTKGT